MFFYPVDMVFHLATQYVSAFSLYSWSSLIWLLVSLLLTQPRTTAGAQEAIRSFYFRPLDRTTCNEYGVRSNHRLQLHSVFEVRSVIFFLHTMEI